MWTSKCKSGYVASPKTFRCIKKGGSAFQKLSPDEQYMAVEDVNCPPGYISRLHGGCVESKKHYGSPDEWEAIVKRRASSVKKGKSPKKSLIKKGKSPKKSLIKKGKSPKKSLIKKGKSPKKSLIKKGKSPKKSLIKKRKSPRKSLIKKRKSPRKSLIKKRKSPRKSLIKKRKSPRKPCTDGKRRSPKTGRCVYMDNAHKKARSAKKSVKNPLTHRKIKVGSPTHKLLKEAGVL
jgi:hypothetical protein